MDALITVALDLAFFVLFGVTFLRWLRERTATSRDTMLVFAAVAAVLIVPLLRGIWPTMPTQISQAAAVLLLALPLLTMNLISNFRPGMRTTLLVSLVIFLATAAAFLFLGDRLRDFIVPLIAGFVSVELAAAYLLAQEAQARAGAGRWRLRLAALGTLLFGVAILVVGAGAAVAAPTDTGERTPLQTAISTTGQVMALLAGLAYIAAFLPPRWLRQIWQRSLAYEFLRQLARQKTNGDTGPIWRGLATAAHSVSGARASAVAVAEDGAFRIEAVDGEVPEDAVGKVLPERHVQGRRLPRSAAMVLDPPGDEIGSLLRSAAADEALSVSVGNGSEADARVLVFARRGRLFIEEDLAVLAILGEHAALAAQRESVTAERTRLLEQLRRINAELAHASAAKSEFLAGMSHELRTPLHAVIGFSELLTMPSPDGSVDPTVKEYAAHIHGAGLHLLDLINDVLDLSKIEAGRLDLQYDEIDIGAIVDRTAKTMRPIATRKSVDLVASGPTSETIEADAPRVRQILFNLLSNAIKFTPTGGRVEIAMVATDTEVRVTVSDNGPGISAEDQERIFEPFEQVTPGARGPEGTGLGLAVTRQLVQGHGGRIELESEVGVGSRFTVVLPRRRMGGDRLAPLVEATPRQAAGGRSVLIAEDDPRAAELMTINLRSAGYEVSVATDGQAALAEAERLHPAAVLLDVLLPVLDGWEVLRKLKESEQTRDIPVVIVSIVEDQEVGFALGAVDYLVKPATREVILASLDRLFPGRNGSVPRRVLAIDDDERALDLYEAALRPTGHEVLRASGGEDGIRLAKEHAPDLILLDLLMPDLDGWAVASRLKDDPATAAIPIVVMTSHDITDDEKRRLNGKVKQVLLKGSDGMEGLLRWLHENTTAGAAGQRPAAPPPHVDAPPPVTRS